MITIKTIDGQVLSINPAIIGSVEIVKSANEIFDGIYLVTTTNGKTFKIKAGSLRDAEKKLGVG